MYYGLTKPDNSADDPEEEFKPAACQFFAVCVNISTTKTGGENESKKKRKTRSDS